MGWRPDTFGAFASSTEAETWGLVQARNHLPPWVQETERVRVERVQGTDLSDCLRRQFARPDPRHSLPEQRAAVPASLIQAVTFTDSSARFHLVASAPGNGELLQYTYLPLAALRAEPAASLVPQGATLIRQVGADGTPASPLRLTARILPSEQHSSPREL